MDTNEMILATLQKTLTKIEELDQKILFIEKNIHTLDDHQHNMAYYLQGIKQSIDNDNIIG